MPAGYRNPDTKDLRTGRGCGMSPDPEAIKALQSLKFICPQASTENMHPAHKALRWKSRDDSYTICPVLPRTAPIRSFPASE